MKNAPQAGRQGRSVSTPMTATEIHVRAELAGTAIMAVCYTPPR